MYFSSKRDFGLGLLIWGILVLATIPAILQKATVPLVIMILIILFAGWIWFGTGYEMMENALKVYCGPFRQTIPYREIKEIKKTRSFSSSAACSLDRMEIQYGESHRILISPADKENFIKTIIKKSPSIQVDEELRKYA